MDEPNGYELQRNIDALRKDMRDGITDIKLIVAGLVSRDLFDSENRRRDEQIAEIKATIAASQTSNWRVWTSVVVPIACVLISVGGSVAVNIILH